MLQAGPVDNESIECGMLKSPPVSDSDSSVARIDRVMVRLSAEERKAVENSDISVGQIADCLIDSDQFDPGEVLSKP